ncbi:tubulin-specific chaperone c [Diaporthe amygdali]|uniref:tubulin-specific chaperone c n=1 Tax=Phomopsis amygdali TaxID=1214568 RepID=UPI0022FDEC86|nr:tubulin-specific chaperone c [Diaporthe amygdali]KAJ0117247.1 tubulin-specific chaperone c [Diaporthe amygdali]
METVLCGPMTYKAGFPGLKTDMDPKERFYRHFEAQATALQEDIANLANISPTGGERKDATDHVLSGISRLTNEVSDASEYAPPRDQMIYGQALKALREQVNIHSRGLGPNTGFEFTQASKDAWVAAGNKPAAAKDADAAEDSDATVQAERTDAVGDLPSISGRTAAGKDYNAEMASQAGAGVRKPSFSQARDIDISNHRGMHIILPATASRATASGTLTELRGCVLDMSEPFKAAQKKGVPRVGAAPFGTLAIRNISGSLIIAGQVAGPAHITGVRDSVLVVNARQVRMHECANVTVYLWCGSHPIVEDCTGVRVAPIPESFLKKGQDNGGASNQWDQVDDFGWLKAEPSPNWRRLGDGEAGEEDHQALPEEFWTSTVKGGPSLSTEDILRCAGIHT